MSDQLMALLASMLTVSQQLISFLTQAERQPAAAPQTKEEKDQTDQVGCIAEAH